MFRVEVFADPGLPSRDLSRVLATSNAEGSIGDYALSYNNRQIPLRHNGTLDLDIVRQWERDNDADFLVIVTEIPRRAGRRVKMVELHFSEGMAVISLPALGWRSVTKTLRAALLDSLDALANHQVPGNGTRRIRFGVVHKQASETGESVYIASPWWWPGRLRLVLGMARTNEPLTAVPNLTGVLAAATATGAFGVFYSSIWEMANTLPNWRLGFMTATVILAMVWWLIVSNRLWERSKQLGSLTEAAMYNASTLVTLGLAVSLLYVVLFVGIFLTALVVIDSGFMTSTLGVEATVLNYVNIAWLSASMGTVAGALGSSFDSEEHIRNLTHGQRQAQRYEERENSRDSPTASSRKDLDRHLHRSTRK